MSLAYGERTSGARDAVSKPKHFWQFIERALDAYSLRRTKRALADKTFRRCSIEVARYRRLLRERDSVRLDRPRGKLAPSQVAARQAR
jgi:hypothetical protein